MRVGRRVAEARHAAGLSQRRLADGICSAAYLSQVERGSRTPSLQVLRRLSQRLGVPERYLAEGTGGSCAAAAVEAEAALRLGDNEVAERLYHDALATAESPSDRAAVLAGLGQLAYRRGQVAEAIEQLEEALRLDERPEVERSAVADTLGRAYATTGEFERAIALFERWLDAAEAASDSIETLRFSVLLANAVIDGGNLGRADEVLARALALADESADPLVRARVYWSQSRLHAMRNDSETAARYARKVVDILDLTEHTEYAAHAHQLLAHIEVDRGNADEALVAARRGEELLGPHGHRLARAHLRLEQARALAQLGEERAAASIAMDSAGVFADADPFDAGRGYALVAEISAKLGERARALELYELAAELLAPVPNRYLLETYTRLAELLEEEGRHLEALEVLKRAMAARLATGRVA